MARLMNPGKEKVLSKGRVNAGVQRAYERSLLLLIRRMHRDTVRKIIAHYIAAAPELAQDNDPDDQPRDRYGRWVAEGGTERKALQEKHKELLDRLEKEDRSRPTYGGTTWGMGERGYDTRHLDEITRPLVLGEISHPDASSKRVPIVFGEGRQRTSKPNGKGHGRRHIEFMHGRQIRSLGFKDALDFAHHIVTNHNSDIHSPQHHSRNLSIFKNNKETMREALHLVDGGDHYRVTTAYPLLEQSNRNR